MLESYTKQDELNFKELTPEESKQRGILARLYGPCASTIKATRNGRYYSDDLWEKVFENPINKELLEKGGIPGELDHPVQRLETDSSKIAIMMPEAPKKDKEGHLVGYWDIIDTPCGKIAYALAKYGFKFGISSRGNGETYMDDSGNESVDPDTYEFTAFDLVLVPACEDARLTAVMTEGLDKNKLALKKALSESLANSTPDDRRIMEETLKDLNIDYKQEEPEEEKSGAADNDGAELIKTLQEALLAKEKVEAKVTELQEKLSVCYAKEAGLEEDLNKYKVAIRNFTTTTRNLKELQKEVASLQEKLSQRDKMLQEKEDKYNALIKRQSLNESRQTNLKEHLSEKTAQLEKANQRIEMLTESIKKEKAQHAKESQVLTENYETLKKDYKIKQTEYTNKLSNANKLVEQYKATAKKAVTYYIESKAKVLGISHTEVLNKLPKNYSFSDIDAVCESLSKYNLQMGNLPFNVNDVRHVEITESKKLPQVLGKSPVEDDGDDVDESLIRLANNLITNN